MALISIMKNWGGNCVKSSLISGGMALAAMILVPQLLVASPQTAPGQEVKKSKTQSAETKTAEKTPEAAKLSPAQQAEQQKILERVTHDIKYLASDEMAGRQPGTPGIKLAEDFIVEEYKKAGLKPLENGTYFQEMEVGNVTKLKSESVEFVLSGPNGVVVQPELGKDWQVLSARRGFSLDQELVFVGYGITAEEHNFNEYAGIDVKDKIVVLIRMEPQGADPKSVFDGAEASRHGSGRAKAVAARQAGAAGVLMVNDAATATDDEHDELIPSDRFGTMSLPFAHIKRSLFNELLKTSPLHTATGKPLNSLTEIEALIDENLEPVSQVMTGWKAKLEADFESSGVKTYNIVGVIEGEGPNADETIIIGGHYDHLGDGAYGPRAGGRREIHNGADDNATGTAAVIELARRFNARDKKPGRRMVFICFTAEEMGLLGAFHYCENPIYPLEKTAAMMNFDMIGWLRNDELTLFNWNTSAQLNPIFNAANEGMGLDLEKPASGFAGSDHLPFNQKGVPNMFIHTGLTDVYHTPEDDFEAINCAGAVRVIDYSERVLDGLANLETMPKFGTPKPFRLGAMLSDENEIVKIDSVTSNSVAAKAGLKDGDILLEIQGEPITSRRAVTRIIRRDQGKSVKMKLKRGDVEIVLNVDLKSGEEE